MTVIPPIGTRVRSLHTNQVYTVVEHPSTDLFRAHNGYAGDGWFDTRDAGLSWEVVDERRESIAAKVAAHMGHVHEIDGPTPEGFYPVADRIIREQDNRPSWDDWALRIAEAVKTRADCTRSQVGAVILSRSHRILSVGYNGLPAGVPGCKTEGNCPRGQLSYDEVPADSDYANCAATRAERNAIEHADPYELPGATLYVTRSPCPACTTLINACGIARVVASDKPECSHAESKATFFESTNRWLHRCGACGIWWWSDAD